MDKFIEPKYWVSDFEDIDGTEFCSIIQAEGEQELQDNEDQVWDWTGIMTWCVENLNGDFKVVMSGYNDLYIELYDEADAVAAKLRWM